MKKNASCTFRAPDSLMKLVFQLMDKTGMSFSEVSTEALNLFFLHAKRKKGMLVPDFTQAAMRVGEAKLGPFGPPKDLSDGRNKKPLF